MCSDEKLMNTRRIMYKTIYLSISRMSKNLVLQLSIDEFFYLICYLINQTIVFRKIVLRHIQDKLTEVIFCVFLIDRYAKRKLLRSHKILILIYSTYLAKFLYLLDVIKSNE